MHLAALAAAGGAGLLFFWFGLRPVLYLQDRHAAEKTQLESRQEDIALMRTRAEDLKKKLSEVRKAVTQSLVQLEPASAINNRISRLAELAADQGLKVNEVQPAEPVYGGNFGSVPIRLNGTGGYRDWAVFLHALSKSFPDTAVESFLLSGKHDPPGSPPEFQVDLVWHVTPK
jgi:Tfp pilus assembly protein PilO